MRTVRPKSGTTQHVSWKIRPQPKVALSRKRRVDGTCRAAPTRRDQSLRRLLSVSQGRCRSERCVVTAIRRHRLFAHSRTSARARLGTTKDARKLARTSFRCIDRRRSRPPLPPKFEFRSISGHSGLAEHDVPVRSGSRSYCSSRPTQRAHRRPSHRRFLDGPPLRSPCASAVALQTLPDLPCLCPADLPVLGNTLTAERLPATVVPG